MTKLTIEDFHKGSHDFYTSCDHYKCCTKGAFLSIIYGKQNRHMGEHAEAYIKINDKIETSQFSNVDEALEFFNKKINRQLLRGK